MNDSSLYSRTQGHIDWVHFFLPSLSQRSRHRRNELPLGLPNMLPPLHRFESRSKSATGSQVQTRHNLCRQQLLPVIPLVHKRCTHEELVRRHHSLVHIPTFTPFTLAFLISSALGSRSLSYWYQCHFTSTLLSLRIENVLAVF